MSAKKYLIVIGGPTGSGKTSLAIEMAKAFQTDIISSDSRQFYRELSIGTAKPSAEELAEAKHHFIDALGIDQSYSVGKFEREARAKLKELFLEKDVLILAGGSGLFINALCQGLDHFPDVPAAIREEVESTFEKEGLPFLQNELRKVDPVYAQQVDMGNPHRLIRAISVFRASGQAFSSFLAQKKDALFFKPIYIQLEWPRAQLYDRINQRVDIMIKSGLEAEVRSLQVKRDLMALRTVGYQEWNDYFDGRIPKDRVIDLIKQNSRRYAKRQLTWMRRDGFWKKFPGDDTSEVRSYVDWMITSGLHLQTLQKQEEKLSFGFFRLDDPLNLVSLESYARYSLASMSLFADSETNHLLLHELVYRCTVFPLFVKNNPEIELSLLNLGFVALESIKDFPHSWPRSIEQTPASWMVKESLS